MRNPTEVPVHPLVAARWSPRAFAERDVPEAVLRRVLEAARWAPSAFNEQPWRLLVARRSADPEGHAKLAAVLNDWNRNWAASAPVLLLVATDTVLAKTGKPNGSAAYDAGGAIAWLTAQATADGLSLHQMGGFSPERARALGLPEQVTPLAMVALGYEGTLEQLDASLHGAETRERERRPIDETVFGAQWGAPRR